METEVIFDYEALVVALEGRTVSINRPDGRTVYVLSEGIEERHQAVLLRIGERVSFYKISQAGGFVADDLVQMLIAVMKKVDGGLFYTHGNCHIRTHRTGGKCCRAVLLGATQIAFRDSRLVFNSIPTKTLGNVVLDDTGDTMPVYVQLNGLI